MAELTSISDVLTQLTTDGQNEKLWWHKSVKAAGTDWGLVVQNQWLDHWTRDGTPSGGALASTATALDNTSVGGLRQTDPGGGRQKWLVGAIYDGPTYGWTIMLYDRLAQHGGFSGTSTSAQSVTFTPPTRYGDGMGNEIWIIIQTQIGTSATTVTASYTDENDTTRTSQSVTIGGTSHREKGRIIRIPLFAGGRGVKDIDSVTLAGSTGTAGDFAVVLAHPLALFGSAGIHQGCAYENFISGPLGPIEIKTDACLVWATRNENGTSPWAHTGFLSMVEK